MVSKSAKPLPKLVSKSTKEPAVGLNFKMNDELKDNIQRAVKRKDVKAIKSAFPGIERAIRAALLVHSTKGVADPQDVRQRLTDMNSHLNELKRLLGPSKETNEAKFLLSCADFSEEKITNFLSQMEGFSAAISFVLKGLHRGRGRPTKLHHLFLGTLLADALMAQGIKVTESKDGPYVSIIRHILHTLGEKSGSTAYIAKNALRFRKNLYKMFQQEAPSPSFTRIGRGGLLSHVEFKK